MEPGVGVLLDVPPDAEPGCHYHNVTTTALLAIPDASSYDHIATSLPWDYGAVNGSSTCTYNGKAFAGLAVVNGRFSWTRGRMEELLMHRIVMFHELGHNFGLGHSGHAADEYGDDTCSMGSGQRLHASTFNGAMLRATGWASAAPLPEGATWLPELHQGGHVLALDDLVISFRGADDTAVRRTRRNSMYIHRYDPTTGDSDLLHAGNLQWHDAGRAITASPGVGGASIRFARNVVPAVVVIVGGAVAAGAAALLQRRRAGAATTPKVVIQTGASV